MLYEKERGSICGCTHSKLGKKAKVKKGDERVTTTNVFVATKRSTHWTCRHIESTWRQLEAATQDLHQEPLIMNQNNTTVLKRWPLTFSDLKKVGHSESKPRWVEHQPKMSPCITLLRQKRPPLVFSSAMTLLRCTSDSRKTYFFTKDTFYLRSGDFPQSQQSVVEKWTFKQSSKVISPFVAS